MKRFASHLLVALAAIVAPSLDVSAQTQSGGVPGPPPPPAVQSEGTTLPANWARFTPEGGGFSVLAPGTPRGEVRTFQLQSGVEAKSAIYTLHKGSIEFIVSYTPLAIDVRDEKFAQTIFDRARDGAVAKMNAKVVDEKSVTVGGRPGRRLKLVAQNTFVEMLSVLGDYKLIGLVVETPGTTETPELAEAAERYFGSLEETH